MSGWRYWPMPETSDLLLRKVYASVEEHERARIEEAEADVRAAREALRATPDEAAAYHALADALRAVDEVEESLDVRLHGLDRSRAPDRRLFLSAVRALGRAGRTDDARRLAGRAWALFPERYEFRHIEQLALPMLYERTEEIAANLTRFARGLEVIEADTALLDGDTARPVADAIGRCSNFALAFTGTDVTSLLRRYGAWQHRVMRTAFPTWDCGSRRPSRGRRRIGFISANLYSHSTARVFRDWVRLIDHERFEIICYHHGASHDAMTESFMRASHGFVELETLETLAPRILADALDVLVYLDVGLTPLDGQLAALRLAPVQCAAWGYSLSSGLPTIDYFVSCDGMEPSDGATHYSESLVRLPGLGVSLDLAPMLRVLRRFPRAYFGLRDDDMVFLCGQSLFKYLPEDDVTIARIAHRVPNARFVFHGHDDHKRELLENRLDRAFGATGLRREDFCIVLPALPHWHYAELQAMGDIALDPFGVSGCNTTINTLKLGIPVVTLPGKFHRNRQSMGLLTACGLTELIAESPDDFVAIAARLGTDRDARHAVMARIRASMRAPGWTDHSYVSALDDFLARAEPTS